GPGHRAGDFCGGLRTDGGGVPGAGAAAQGGGDFGV
ncbi:ribitol transporter, partial [Enterobacter hormaechei]